MYVQRSCSSSSRSLTFQLRLDAVHTGLTGIRDGYIGIFCYCTRERELSAKREGFDFFSLQHQLHIYLYIYIYVCSSSSSVISWRSDGFERLYATRVRSRLVTFSLSRLARAAGKCVNYLCASAADLRLCIVCTEKGNVLILMPFR